MTASVWTPYGASLPVAAAASTLMPQVFTATIAQTLFTLTAFNYTPATGSLLVFINGVAQIPGTDFTETSVTSFTLNAGLVVGDIVLAFGFIGITATLPSVTAQAVAAAASATAALASQTAAATSAGAASTSASAASTSATNAATSAAAALVSQNAAAASAASIAGAYGVIGLVGANNAGAPTTKFDISADSVALRNSSGTVIVRYVTGSITCDFAVVGSAANGRDQAGAFSANSWIYLYFIWNGTTLATLASITTPASFTGSTLPSGYTHWCFATAVRWNGSSNINSVYVRGKTVSNIAEVTIFVGQVVTSNTNASLTSFIPPNALMVYCRFEMVSATGGDTGYLRLLTSSNAFCVLSCSINTYNTTYIGFPNIAQNIVYMVLTGVAQASLYLNSYTVPNGDS